MSLEPFHPLVRRWFEEQVGNPTDIQERAWPVIAKNEHSLITAPTGSGKTLTAFLWALNQLLSGAWDRGGLRVLYISPLKALNNDIQKNLRQPLEGIREYFEQSGQIAPDVEAVVRSGDSTAAERRRMLKRPPEILITTPESLNVLLTSGNGRQMLQGIRTLILDEIHVLAGSRRGAYLMSAVERLLEFHDEFQRIALSATVRPLEEVASFVGGRMSEVREGRYLYQKRPVQIVRAEMAKNYDITVRFPEAAKDSESAEDWWPALTEAWRGHIIKNDSTLLFSNSRRMTEKISRLINEGGEGMDVYSHHGSLSKEVRKLAEERLKKGELSTIVATSSLELGIDVGSIEEVLLVETPPDIAAGVQRIGRAGHGVGETSRGSIYPLHSRDFMEAAVLARSVKEQDIEEIIPVRNPLDVLAQVILSMVSLEAMSTEKIYGILLSSYSFETLSRREFELVLDMLAGRYAETRIRELKPRILRDPVQGTIKARREVQRLLFMSGGVIADRGYFNLRVQETKAKIGELDEEFVWERSLGDIFPLGNRLWRIQNITHNDVEVTPVSSKVNSTPFWRATTQNRSFHFSRKLGEFLQHADLRLKDADFQEELERDYYMSPSAAEELISFLKRQKEATRRPLPHRKHLLAEHYNDPKNKDDAKQVILHTIWGGERLIVHFLWLYPEHGKKSINTHWKFSLMTTPSLLTYPMILI